MNIDTIVVLIYFTLITIALFIGLIYIIKSLTTKENDNIVPIDNGSVEKIKILMEKDSIQKIDDLVDALISNAVDKYMILNVNFDREKYLKQEEQEQLSQYVYGMVIKNMTKSVLDTIGLIYDISTDEKLKEFLDIRIKIYVLAIIVNQNKDIDIRVQ